MKKPQHLEFLLDETVGSKLGPHRETIPKIKYHPKLGDGENIQRTAT
jgi:hypothetical protein